MTQYDFDDVSEIYKGVDKNIVPFGLIDDHTNEPEVLRWLNSNFDRTYEALKGHFEGYRRNYLLYKGVHWRYSGGSSRNTYKEDSFKNPKHTVNFIYDMVESRISMRSKRKASIAVIPSNGDEIDDINNAKACKMIIKFKSEELNIDDLHTKIDRHVDMFGTAFTFIEKNEQGDDLRVHSPLPTRVFEELDVPEAEDLNHIEYVKWENSIMLDDKYSDGNAEISLDELQDSNNERSSTYDSEYELVDLQEGTSRDGQTLVHYFFHRATEKVPKGMFIKYTKDRILEMDKLPNETGKLYVTIDKDIDVPEELRGRSFISNISQLQRAYNNIQSAIMRDFGLSGGPKWIYKAGSVKKNKLANGALAISYKGPVEPKLIHNYPTHKMNFDIQDRIEKKITSLARVYDVQRGVIPKGITANSALRFLDEQETQQSEILFNKKKKRIRSVYRFMLQVMKETYHNKKSPTVVKMLGKDNDCMIKSFGKSDVDFTRVDDIMIENTSALPDTKSGKISTIIDLNMSTQTDPVFTKESIVQILDLGIDDHYKNAMTAAVTSAKMIIDMMSRAENVPEPSETDNLLVHYSEMYMFMQTTRYQIKTEAAVKEMFNSRMMTIEGLMYINGAKSIAFLNRLIEIPHYPIFFAMPQPLTFLLIQLQGGNQIDINSPETGKDIAQINKLDQLTKGE